MKQVLTKEDVSKAISDLAQQGKRPTMAAIHAMLNHRGSMSTLVRLKSELDASTRTSNDSPEGLKVFRQTWALAVAEGRQQQEALVSDLRESLNAVATENERLEGLAAAARARSEDLELARSRAETELRDFQSRVQTELDRTRTAATDANAKAAEALSRLAELQAKHATQVEFLQNERDSAIGKAHEMEIKLTRALALLEGTANPPNQ